MRTKVLRNVTWGFLLALMAACTPTNDTAILVERESNFNMEETLERIQNAAGELGYTVPIVHDMQDGKTYVSWTNYAHFSQLEHGISMEVFRQVGSDYDEIMQGIVKE
jgi:formate-dependent phosphoribosylglycinamide formyltransferase (GAR transformylase)